jgi:hypothetical protein
MIMLKGKTIIELTDVRTGRKEIHEDENLVTEAVADILNTNIQGVMYNNTNFNNANGENWLLPIYKNLTGGVLLYQDEIEEDPALLYAPLDNPLIGYASDDANDTTDTKRGNRNLTESKAVDGGFKYVWDFATSQGNGTISAVCLSNVLAGKGVQDASNYFVGLKSDTVQSGIADANADRNSYQDNQRPYIGDGYRLECITVNNSTSALLRKVPEDYLHARLMQRTYGLIATEADEETTVELNHYPYWIHYVGGSKDDTDEPANNNTNVLCYLFHASDGNWYGLSRKETKTYSYSSGTYEYYNHTSYEWYLDKISGDQCTSQKIAVPDETSTINNIGMSGKWLMFAIGTTVYRLDTTSVANLEVVTNVTYNSSYMYTFSIDDDVVINGWYFLDGEPKLYVRNQTEMSYWRWGKKHMARYKTFVYQEGYYSYSNYYFVKELYLYTPYLATINNLSTPVIKTADKTMKITYTLTETES